MIEELLVANLLAAGGFTSVFGDRLSPNLVDQNALLGGPSACYQVINDAPANTADGTNAFGNARIQFDVFAASYGAVKTAARALEAALTIPDPRYSLLVLFRRDLYDSQTQQHRVTLDISIWRTDS